MTDVLGQRSLLGLGVLVAWLVLFHLLVNIWLLCVFTSLLVVLGGWLGSQAVLESNSVVHLERFITLEQIKPSDDDELLLDQEIHKTVSKIVRDFVSSWYSSVSSERRFEMEVHEAMISMGMELKMRARKVDRKALTQRILHLIGSHLQDYLRAKEQVTMLRNPPAAKSSEDKQMWRAYSSMTTPHPAMESELVHINYTRALVDMLLHVLVPSPHLETHTGRLVVGELITCNVLLPFMAKLSDPDWLNLLLIEIFGGSSYDVDKVSPDAPIASTQQVQSPVQLEGPLNEDSTSQKTTEAPFPQAEAALAQNGDCVKTESSACDFVDADDLESQQSIAEEDHAQPFLRQYMRGAKSNPFYQENDSDLDSPLADYKRSSIDSLLMMGQEDGLYGRQKEYGTSVESNSGNDSEDVCPSPVNGHCPKVLVNSVDQLDSSVCSPVRQVTGPSFGSLLSDEREGSSPSTTATRELVLGVEIGRLGSSNELTVATPLSGTSPLGAFSFEALSSPDGPIIIQNLRITGTITAKEHRGTGSHPYTLYTIKYETAMGCENPASVQSVYEEPDTLQTAFESSPSIQPVAYHMVNRRYSEFLNLQTRLEERGELKKLIKGVKGPKKIFPEMPFGNMDSEKIEARRGMLETYVKHLCAVPEIANSEEMQEFLALNTDARIAFVKKPFIVSRIDKIVVNAIVDTLKTAFPRSEPQSPTEDSEEMDGGRISGDKKNKSRLKFSSKSISLMNGSDVRQPVLFSSEQTCTMFSGMSLESLKAFISGQENLAAYQEQDSPTLREFGFFMQDKSSGKQSHSDESETALAEVALNIMCLLMKEQWSWLCTENIQRTIRLLFGTLINRWLDVSVANLTCAGYWVTYLQVIQEAVWPGGVLPTLPPVERSLEHKERTKQQALHVLMGLLPDLISDLLGSEKYKISWQIVLDSLQDPFINKHLLHCIFDLLLESLIPELPEQDFQRNLLQSLSKNPEKLLA
ncbi:sorting nexin-19 [Synchiropus splendidus]|uniref:sorting nexin-19 n=1 Tax=Synchiropus splendidus TaxID=270530 RepID=UPI00237E80DE|nr:sorting nexin-19 [Synchiropus splendidus]XP_053729274.1 sorting nexin-19 [Synchiropus splendidus]